MIFWGSSYLISHALLPAIPSLSRLCFRSLHHSFPFTMISPTFLYALFFLFSFTLLQLLFYHPRHPCPSLTPPPPARSSPGLPPPRLALSRVCRQLLSGKVTLCVISAFHGSPLSLQRVIISFRVKGSICYKRTRASGMEGARVGVWGGEERRMELIGRERGRKVGEKGDEGWKWEWMRGWDREAMREEQPKHSIFTVLRGCVAMLGGVGGGGGWRHSSLVSLSGPRLHHLAQTQRPGNINGVQKKKASSSEAGYFRLHCCFLDPYLYLDPAGILDVANTVINNQSSEFNQSVPHCFPRKSFVSVRKPEPSASASAAWCSSFLPAAPSQLSPNAFSLHVCFMDKHLFDLYFFPNLFFFLKPNAFASLVRVWRHKQTPPKKTSPAVKGSRGQCGCCWMMDAACEGIPATAAFTHFQQTSKLWDSSISYLLIKPQLSTARDLFLMVYAAPSLI